MLTPTPAAGPTSSPHSGMWYALIGVVILGVIALMWYSGAFSPKPRIALVTASEGPYWDLVVKGAQDAADRHNVKLDIKRPASDEPSQTKVIQDLISQGYDGVAVSPNDAVRQARVLSDLASKTNLVTFDADAEVPRRLCFVGTDNYDAGRMCGTFVREALPGGGNIILAIGSLEKENGHRRRQGLIDELLERPFEPDRPMDPVEGTLKGPRYTILTTLVDGINPVHATEMATEALKANADVKCMVGLFAYSTPALLKALEASGKSGEVKVVGFDANDETLAGIEQGTVHASIIQDAYNIGYYSVRILADAASGEENAGPAIPTFHLEPDPVTIANLAEMRKAMASRHKPVLRPTTNPTAAAATARPTTQPQT